MDSSESNKDDLLDFDEYFIFPHHRKLQENVENSFINATLHCLTNIKSFIVRIYYLKNGKTVLLNLIKSIFDEKDLLLTNNLKEFVKYIISEISFKDKSKYDPRILIDYILNHCLKNDNSDYEMVDNSNDFSSNYSNSHSPALFTNLKNPEKKIEQLNSFSLDISNFKLQNENNNYKIILKKNKICQNEECKKVSNFYKSISILRFKLNINEDKIYTINDCFVNFLKNEKNENEFCPYCKKLNNKMETKILINNLPDDIFIFIYYDDEKKKDYQKFYYNFDEIIDFSKLNITVDKIKEKKYFLSSLIACKYPKDKEDELFYTFCRKDLELNFFVYNNSYINDKIKNIKNKIIKLKDEDLNKKRSFPYVLVYSSF